MLAVANASIIERDGKEIVYEQIHPGHYEPHEIRTGLKGETYTEVLDGIAAGDNIVAIGSFFIDAEYRLKSTPGNGADAHQHH
jgi:Cu(I)/Ag(I) efflux system membrane fusion protein